jgi:hypothetical protein
MMMLAVMYGMIPSAKDRQLQQSATAEQVHQRVEVRALAVLGKVDAALNSREVDAGRRDEGPEPEQRHDCKREQDLASEVGSAKRPGERGEHANLLRAARQGGSSS